MTADYRGTDPRAPNPRPEAGGSRSDVVSGSATRRRAPRRSVAPCRRPARPCRCTSRRSGQVFVSDHGSLRSGTAWITDAAAAGRRLPDSERHLPLVAGQPVGSGGRASVDRRAGRRPDAPTVRLDDRADRHGRPLLGQRQRDEHVRPAPPCRLGVAGPLAGQLDRPLVGRHLDLHVLHRRAGHLAGLRLGDRVPRVGPDDLLEPLRRPWLGTGTGTVVGGRPSRSTSRAGVGDAQHHRQRPGGRLGDRHRRRLLDRRLAVQPGEPDRELRPASRTSRAGRTARPR